ncbi:MAG: binding-protein-dependent transport system inner membrane protein [Chloroflexi bacterium OLB15]|nr:MAG: binding-protein-dependent transport system inner membrane protein [Chloroflexi bacterium OLB15]
MKNPAKSSTSRKKFPTHLLVFLGPAIVIYTVFMVYPLFDSLRLSLYAPSAGNSRVEEFVGLANYQRLLTDPLLSPRLTGAIGNNFVFFIVHMFVQNPIALVLATLLASVGKRSSAVYRTLIFTPTVLSFVLVGFIWQIILNPLWGIADDVLGIFGLESQPWLGLPGTALPTLSLISVWQFVGIPMMLFLVALIGIPEELIEAGRVDGASAWRVFWSIKFPLILPTVGIVAILTFVGNFNAFDLVYTVQGSLAGPNFATDLLGTFFYRTFFGFQLQPGNPTMGAAVAGVMFLIIMLGVVLYLVGWQRRITQYEL